MGVNIATLMAHHVHIFLILTKQFFCYCDFINLLSI